MRMTYTVTLNPALDISGSVNNLVPNEKNYVTHELRTPGRNGINAAIISHRLGLKVMATGFLGGPVGEEVQSLLQQENILHAFVPISRSTRINVTVSDEKTHFQTRLSFPGPKIKGFEYNQLLAFLQRAKTNDLVLFGGSLPPGILPKALALLIRALNKRGVRCLVDVPGDVLREIINSEPFFIKPNLTEFQQLIGKKVKTIKSILPLVRKLNHKIPLICVSSVEGGALLVNKGEAWYGKIPRVRIYSSVGAGDSMVGGDASASWPRPNNSSRVPPSARVGSSLRDTH